MSPNSLQRRSAERANPRRDRRAGRQAVHLGYSIGDVHVHCRSGVPASADFSQSVTERALVHRNATDGVVGHRLRKAGVPSERADRQSSQRLISLLRFACRSPISIMPPATFQHEGIAVKQCPVCHGTDVERSHFHHAEARAHRFHSPYRCRRCGRRFWVLSRKARVTVGALAVGACLLTAMVFTVRPLLTRSGSPAPNPAAASTSSSGVVVPAPTVGSGEPKP